MEYTCNLSLEMSDEDSWESNCLRDWKVDEIFDLRERYSCWE